MNYLNFINSVTKKSRMKYMKKLLSAVIMIGIPCLITVVNSSDNTNNNCNTQENEGPVINEINITDKYKNVDPVHKLDILVIIN